MNRARICCLAVLAALPLFAHAQAYKCKQPNGSTSFQDYPCDQVGARGAAIPEAPPQKQDTRSPRQAMLEAQEASRQREAEAIRTKNQQIAAENKAMRCNQARQQLGILKEQRPVYSRDNKGEKQYVEDKDRPALIAAAEQRVAAECQ